MTVTVTPVLADQLEAAGRRRSGCSSSRASTGSARPSSTPPTSSPACVAACEAEAERYREALAALEGLGGNALEAFAEAGALGPRRARPLDRHPRRAAADRHARGRGCCSSTPACAPTGAASAPRGGFWLPECAYAPGLEHLLAELGIEHFCVDQSAHEPPDAALRPIATDGPTAFPIDWEAIQWLWSLDGYPSDPLYADFHRKSLRGTRPWSIGGGAYDPAAAAGAGPRAGARVRRRRRRAARRAPRGERPAAACSSFAIDTELLGHWWWEGPIWLEEALEALPAAGVRPLTLARRARRARGRAAAAARVDLGREQGPADLGLAARSPTWPGRPAGSSCGCCASSRPGRLRGDALERAARELLAVQASDWAFLDYRRQAGDYPYERVLDHSRALFESIDSGDAHGADPAKPGSRPHTRTAARALSPHPPRPR